MPFSADDVGLHVKARLVYLRAGMVKISDSLRLRRCKEKGRKFKYVCLKKRWYPSLKIDAVRSAFEEISPVLSHGNLSGLFAR